MKKLLQALIETHGPSGYEHAVRDLIRKTVKPFADEIRVDALGNLIIRKGKLGKSGRKIMLAAHMDEIGLMVNYVDENGFVRFTPIGRQFDDTRLGSRVSFLNGVQGIIGHDRSEKSDETPALAKMFIDVGTTNKKQCPVKVGDVAVFESPFLDLGNRVAAKSLDNRAGVLVMIETMRRLRSGPNEVYLAFTTQEEFTAYGAATAAFGIEPEIGIAVDATPSGDTPLESQSSIALGKGPAIRVKDQFMLADPRLVAWMRKTAEKSRFLYQMELLLTGTSGAFKIQNSGVGVSVGAVSIPVRYSHSPSEMIDMRDLESCIRLLVALLRVPVKL